jgi:hypothetical protein
MFPNWQPIDTAPKDGTRILIFEPGYGLPGLLGVTSLGTIRLSCWRKDAIPMGWTGSERPPSHWLPLPPSAKARVFHHITTAAAFGGLGSQEAGIDVHKSTSPGTGSPDARWSASHIGVGGATSWS